MKKILLVFAALFGLPIITALVLSFINDDGILTLQNYMDLLLNCFVFYPMFWNSVLYALIITLIQLVVIIPCAFGFTHAKFRGKGLLFVFYAVLMMMPPQVTILPNYIGLRDMGLIDTPLCVILPAIFSPFGAVVMRQYMRGANVSVIEAARLETNSVIRVIFYACLPEIKVCVFAVALFVFADCYNMMEQPLLFLKNDALKTLPVFIANAERYEGGVLFPASVIFMIPVLLLYGFFSGSLEKGLTFGDLI